MKKENKIVVIETPWRSLGEIGSEYPAYARRCLLHSIHKGETPLASHLLYTQVLNDDNPSERARGMRLGWHMYAVCDAVVFYVDWGMSTGMYAAYSKIKGMTDPPKIILRKIGAVKCKK